jgi:hypothetical protein
MAHRDCALAASGLGRFLRQVEQRLAAARSCTQLNRRWRIYLATGKRISHLPITLDKLL